MPAGCDLKTWSLTQNIVSQNSNMLFIQLNNVKSNELKAFRHELRLSQSFLRFPKAATMKVFFKKNDLMFNPIFNCNSKTIIFNDYNIGLKTLSIMLYKKQKYLPLFYKYQNNFLSIEAYKNIGEIKPSDYCKIFAVEPIGSLIQNLNYCFKILLLVLKRHSSL